MEWLNYHHLLYFWTVAREGSVSRAARQLRLAQPTVSGQLRALEERLGEKLFERSGRALVLTDVGRLVYRYADDIFALGRELLDTLRDRPTGRPLRLQVGIADQVTKTIAHRLLEPAFRAAEALHLVCREGPPDRLLADLATHQLDLVISDAPIPPAVRVRAFNHLLGESGVTVFALPKPAAAWRRGFPASLDGVPWLMPAETSSLRRSLDEWCRRHGVRPRVVAEVDDSALLKVFGQAGRGVFAAPTVVEAEIAAQYGVAAVGRLEGARERFYAITVERRITHPAVVAISEGAPALLRERKKG
ncbi:MAG: transcriptional activator NhaR [Acidobacteriota bacterium]